MRRGSTPQQASNTAINRITKYYPDFSGAIIAVNKNGDYAISCNGMTSFPYIAVINGNVTLNTDACAAGSSTGSGYKQKKTIFVFILLMFFILV